MRDYLPPIRSISASFSRRKTRGWNWEFSGEKRISLSFFAWVWKGIKMHLDEECLSLSLASIQNMMMMEGKVCAVQFRRTGNGWVFISFFLKKKVFFLFIHLKMLSVKRKNSLLWESSLRLGDALCAILKIFLLNEDSSSSAGCNNSSWCRSMQQRSSSLVCKIVWGRVHIHEKETSHSESQLIHLNLSPIVMKTDLDFTTARGYFLLRRHTSRDKHKKASSIHIREKNAPLSGFNRP